LKTKKEGGNDMGKTSSKINKIEAKVAKLEKEVNRVSDNQILILLQESNSPYTQKPRYTYEEISNISGKSTGHISNLAKKHGLSRRNLNLV
jgi:t-SNARE complex subunit (syntaxin)